MPGYADVGDPVALLNRAPGTSGGPTRRGRQHDAQGRIVMRQRKRLSRRPDTWHYTWDFDGDFRPVTQIERVAGADQEWIDARFFSPSPI